MIVRSLELSEYRNYSSLQVDFDPGINLIYGDNAQGKTNILEAIYECATARSHRGSKDREIIRFGAEEAHIRLQMEKGGIPGKIDMHFRTNKPKGAAIDGIPIRRASELFGQLHVVFFSPEDLRIIKSSPQERRRFLDLELCQLSKWYTQQLIDYNKALLQRNELLRSMPKRQDMNGMLDIWNSQLVRCGLEVMKERRSFIADLAGVLAPIHEELTSGKERLELTYAPSAEEGSLEERLFLAHDTDLHLGTTTIGPHRDDLCFVTNGIDVRKFGSQGQQRTVALSLKLAEIELVKKRLNDTPVLLLDDVLSELDGSRQEKLLQSLDRVQTFLTCTGLDDFVRRSVGVNKRFFVTEGRMTEEGK